MAHESVNANLTLPRNRLIAGVVIFVTGSKMQEGPRRGECMRRPIFGSTTRFVKR